MSSITFDQVMEQLRLVPPELLPALRAALQLDTAKQQRLLETLPQSPAIQPPEVKVRQGVARNFTREMQWIRANAHLYPGEHLAISGDQLLAHNKDLGTVFTEAKATGQRFLTHYQPPADEIWGGGMWL